MPPVNDNFADRIVLTGYSFSVEGDNTDATVETGEPDYESLHHWTDNSVWYEYTPLVDGTLTLSTEDSISYGDDPPAYNYDTVIWVFTGVSVNALTLVDFNDDGEDLYPGSYLSYLTLPVTAGVPYKIAVTGYGSSDVGRFILSGGMDVPPPPEGPLYGIECGQAGLVGSVSSSAPVLNAPTAVSDGCATATKV